ncbi:MULTISPECIES: hypothetical protein [Cyanophyceae]|nr:MULTISPECIES: hypothetical protein [Cyanophyceae]
MSYILTFIDCALPNRPTMTAREVKIRTNAIRAIAFCSRNSIE